MSVLPLLPYSSTFTLKQNNRRQQVWNVCLRRKAATVQRMLNLFVLLDLNLNFTDILFLRFCGNTVLFHIT